MAPKHEPCLLVVTKTSHDSMPWWSLSCHCCYHSLALLRYTRRTQRWFGCANLLMHVDQQVKLSVAPGILILTAWRADVSPTRLCHKSISRPVSKSGKKHSGDKLRTIGASMTQVKAVARWLVAAMYQGVQTEQLHDLQGQHAYAVSDTFATHVLLMCKHFVVH